MDELYLDNIDEFVNDHDKIVSGLLTGDYDIALSELMAIY